MIWRSIYLALIAILPALIATQELPTPPSENQPQIWVARAFEQDGCVFVAFTMPVLRPITDTVEAEVDGKNVALTRVRYEFEYWQEAEVKLDEKGLKAFDVHGKAITPKDLQKRLSKATKVAVMLHHPSIVPKLDTFYLQALREDIVVFTVPTTIFFTFAKVKGP